MFTKITIEIKTYMLFINLTPILYTLRNFRAYVLKKPTTKSNIALLANNTIVFNISKIEIENIDKLKKKKIYNSLILSYNKINYLDDQYQHLNKQYPFLKTLNTTYNKFFKKLFKILVRNDNSNLSNVILTRQRTKFEIRVLGILGNISILSFLIHFANLWNKKIITYIVFMKMLLRWLSKLIILNINSIFIKFYLFKKDPQKIKKKVVIKKSIVQKPIIIFSNENVCI